MDATRPMVATASARGEAASMCGMIPLPVCVCACVCVCVCVCVCARAFVGVCVRRFAISSVPPSICANLLEKGYFLKLYFFKKRCLILLPRTPRNIKTK